MKSIFDEQTRNDINDLVDSYAKEKGYDNGDVMVASMHDNIQSAQPTATQERASNEIIQFVKDITPQIFKQMIDNKAQYGNYMEMMQDDWWMKIDEGNGQTYFSNIAGGPDNTVPLENLRNKLNNNINRAPNQQWSITYYKDPTTKKIMSDYAYAFHKAIDIQEAMVLEMFRTGAGKAFIRGIVETLYSSLVFTLFAFWSNAKFGINLSNEINGRNLVTNGQGENAFTCWVEVFAIIRDMCLNNNKYNYDGNFIRMSSCELEDIVLYMNTETLNTFRTCLLSQLYNSGKFTDIIDRVTIRTPGYELKLASITPGSGAGAPNTLSSTTTNLQMGQMGLNDTNEMVWVTGENQIIPNNQIWIMTKGGQSFRWIQQVDLSAKQFFANNFTTTNVVYTYGAMKWVPDGKVCVYQSNNLNTNPTNATITLATGEETNA